LQNNISECTFIYVCENIETLLCKVATWLINEKNAYKISKKPHICNDAYFVTYDISIVLLNLCQHHIILYSIISNCITLEYTISNYIILS